MTTQRRDILAQIGSHLAERDIVVAALAGTTADTYQVIDRPGNLYLVGLGMITQVSLGLALALPESKIVALDTDGSLLLAPSILAVAAAANPDNLRIVVFDNERLFGSRGGAPSQTNMGADLSAMARAAGFQQTDTLVEPKDIGAKVDWLFAQEGLTLLTAKIEPGARNEGPRMDGQENKYQLIRGIEQMQQTSILGPPKV